MPPPQTPSPPGTAAGPSAGTAPGSRDTPVDPAGSGESLATLLARYRVHAREPRRVVAALTDSPRTPRELIQESGLPRRTVEEILTSLGDDLRTRPDGRRVLRPAVIDRYRALIRYDELRAEGLVDPLAGAAGRHSALTTRMHELIAAAPAPRSDLDHVPATAATLIRRAVWLRSRYDLAGAHLLCVGDHDLTSLAVAALADDVTVTVVDIDEDLLAHLDHSARSLGVAVQCLYADLRFGLPPSVVGTADLIFTDPPYTPEGVTLFCSRGAEALADRDHGRVLMAYGFSQRVPTLGWKVQRALVERGFAFEAILPAFHTYEGAEAVGAHADMYVCRPTPTTWKQLDRPPGAGSGSLPALYTRGRQSAESQPVPWDTATEEAVAAFFAEVPAPAGRAVHIGERPLGAALHLRLGTAFDRGLPPAATARPATGPATDSPGGEPSGGTPPGGAPWTISVAADLSDDPGPWLARLLMAVNADRLAVVLRADHPDLADPRRGALDALVRPKWTAAAPRAAGRFRLLTFTAVDEGSLAEPDRLRRQLLDRAHGRVGNVWREGLIRVVRDAGAALSKRDARDRVARAAADPDLLTARLLDLPRHAVESLFAAVATTTTTAADTAAAAATGTTTTTAT